MALFLEKEKPSNEVNYIFRLDKQGSDNTVYLFIKNSVTDDDLYVAEFVNNDDNSVTMQVDAWALKELGIKLLKNVPAKN